MNYWYMYNHSFIKSFKKQFVFIFFAETFEFLVDSNTIRESQMSELSISRKKQIFLYFSIVFCESNLTSLIT